jgi:hypothetical protein
MRGFLRFVTITENAGPLTLTLSPAGERGQDDRTVTLIPLT